MSADFSANRGSEAENQLDLVRATLSRKWLILSFAIIGGVFGYLQFLRTPPTYQASARVAVTWNRPAMNVQEGYDPNSWMDPIPGHIARIRSPIIIDEAVKSFNVTSLPSVGTSNPSGAILGGLSVVRDEDSDDVLHFSYRCGSSSDCPKVLGAVVNAYISYLEETQEKSLTKAIHLITSAKDDMIEEIETAEGAYSKFRESAALLWAGREGMNIHTSRLSQIESTRSKLLIDRAQTSSKLAAIQAAIARGGSREALLLVIDQINHQAAAAGVGSENSTASVAAQLMPMALEAQLLLEEKGAGHPKTQEIQKRIAFTRNFLEQERSLKVGEIAPTAAMPDLLTVYTDALHHELEFIDEQIAGLDKLFADQQTAAKSLAADENTDRAHREDIDRKNRLYETILDKLEAVDLAKEGVAFSGFSAELMDPLADGYQVAPNLSRSLTIGGLLGAFAGILLTMLIEMSDRSYRDPAQIARDLGVPVVAHVPALRKIKETRLLDNSPFDPALVVYHRPGSRDAESYRSVRTALLMGAQERHRVVQITSPSAGDGKSTLSTNLAVSIAKSGKRCLLMDCDFRRPRVHKVFGLDKSPGISSIILDGAELPDVTHSGGIPDLDILTAGPHTSNPSELILSPQFAELLALVRERYDFVVVDTPPLLAVSDASAVATMVDGVLMVLRISRQSRVLARQAKESLDLVGGKLAGIVVNSVAESPGYGMGYGDHKYRYSQYYYGKKYYDERHVAEAVPELEATAH